MSGAASSAPPRSIGRSMSGESDVLGIVVDEYGAPVVGREIIIVDARARRSSALTDEGGGFWAPSVSPPYDLGVAPAPSGPSIVPVAYLGVTRADPKLTLVEREGRGPEAPPRVVRVSVSLPECPGSACWVSVVTWSKSGGGVVGRSAPSGQSTFTVDVEHSWRAGDGVHDEPIDVHVISGDEGYSQMVYGRAQAALHHGDEPPFADVTPIPVEISEPVTIAAEGAAPAGSEWTLATRIRVPTGAALPLHYVAGAALITRLPRLAGATLEVGAWARPPRGDAGSPSRSSFAWARGLALAGGNVALAVPRGIDVRRPSPGARISRRAPGFDWSRSSVGMAIAELTAANGQRVFRAHASGGTLSFARLERLGIRRPGIGEHRLLVTDYSDRTVDDCASANASEEPSSVGGASAGTVTHEELSFLVVP